MGGTEYQNYLYNANEAYTSMALLPISRPTATYANPEWECDHSAAARSAAATTNLWCSTSAAGKHNTAAWNGARSRFAAGTIYATNADATGARFAAGTIYATNANTTGANNLPHTTAGHTAYRRVNDSFKFFKYSGKNLGWWNLKSVMRKTEGAQDSSA